MELMISGVGQFCLDKAVTLVVGSGRPSRYVSVIFLSRIPC
jgi:hypothetical protein